ncbi:uncharacterized protein LOC124926083 [Impatiens glandulifera]|uniref:uncharacterized protein LOC124926083 n=1 Tax=Impatiens glandulifera TaxID=253017 RepID=UPI001FB17CB5|nr:uncharacterized protein LOC124926083 [Impatiens glandulifera]
MDFPTCFGENVIQVANASCSSLNRSSTDVSCSNLNHNTVICVYNCNVLGYSCLVTITWSKNLMGQFYILQISDFSGKSLSKSIIKLSLFSKRKGFKTLEMNSIKLGLFWDLSSANFGSGPEPIEGFYLALVCYGEMVLIIGDMKKEAFEKTGSILSIVNATFVSKREHIFGKRAFGTKVRFHDDGPIHELMIDCDTVDNSRLVISLDSNIALIVKRLQWKFRGNQTISIDGAAVEVFWDLYNWLFGTAFGEAVFVFQTSAPEEEKLRCCSEQSFQKSNITGLGFSLVFCASK